jgi:hypothetical protein
MHSKDEAIILPEVWEIIQRHLPKLKADLVAILK